MFDHPTLQFALKVFELACIAVGGYVTILPDLQRYVVDVQGWMGGAEFALLFAIAVAAPGPNFMIVTLLGWTMGGVAGAVSATVAAVLPTFAISLIAGLQWNRFRGSKLQILLTRSLAPIAVGMLFTTSMMLIETTWAGEYRKLILIGLVAAYSVFTKWNPLWPMAAAAILGAVGVV